MFWGFCSHSQFLVISLYIQKTDGGLAGRWMAWHGVHSPLFSRPSTTYGFGPHFEPTKHSTFVCISIEAVPDALNEYTRMLLIYFIELSHFYSAAIE